MLEIIKPNQNVSLLHLNCAVGFKSHFNQGENSSLSAALSDVPKEIKTQP